MKKIFIHLGLYKTGTTTFQNFMRENSGSFLKENLFVPPIGSSFNSNKEKVSFGSFSGGLHAIPNGIKKGDISPIKAFLSCFEGSGADSALITSEGLCSLTKDEIYILSRALDGYQVVPLVVIRNPVKLAVSLYCSRGVPRKATPKNYLNTCLKSRTFHYPQIISEWSDCFGEDIKIIKFEECEDVVESISSEFGFPDILRASEFSRKRESIPAHVAIALADISRGFGQVTKKELLRTLYPYGLIYHDDVSSIKALKGASPFQLNDLESFLSSWENMVSPDINMMGLEDYLGIPDGLSFVDQWHVEMFKSGFLSWVFNEKLPAVKSAI